MREEGLVLDGFQSMGTLLVKSKSQAEKLSKKCALNLRRSIES